MNDPVIKSVPFKKMLFRFIIVFLILFSSAFVVTGLKTNAMAGGITQTEALRIFRDSDLAPYDGTDPNKPIYIGFNGKVYDVTSGKFFYDRNGVYHYLAGRDSTKELNIFGGNIIKEKYPVVGELIK